MGMISKTPAGGFRSTVWVMTRTLRLIPGSMVSPTSTSISIRIPLVRNPRSTSAAGSRVPEPLA